MTTCSGPLRIPPQGDVEYVKLNPLSEMEPSVLKTTCVDRIGLATTWRIYLLDKYYYMTGYKGKFTNDVYTGKGGEGYPKR